LKEGRITFRIQRFHPERGPHPFWQDYTFELKPAMTVLEGLYQVLEYIDHTLAFRSSCRAAVCGSCAMHINGKYRLACNTQISSLKSSQVVIQPLYHMPVLKDLVVDHARFFENMLALKPWLIEKEAPPKKEYLQSPGQRKKLEVVSDCIMCQACYASCPVAGTDNQYFGPHAFLKALRFVNDSRDGAQLERLQSVSGETGVFRCHTIFNCQEVCRKHLDPSGAIARLKMALTINQLKGKLKAKRQ
jgi:succinate dehydrogenase / fumarate reductase iron-sulfur subunit